MTSGKRMATRRRRRTAGGGARDEELGTKKVGIHTNEINMEYQDFLKAKQSHVKPVGLDVDEGKDE